MAARKPIIAFMIITGAYVVIFTLVIIYLLVFTDESMVKYRDNFRPLGVFAIFSLGLFTGGSLFLYFFPEIRERIHNKALTAAASPYEVILHISTSEEILVVKAIDKLSPKVYQFEISKETGLSRMKIHRIVTRLSERGIINVEKIGKNSQISLSNWMKKK
ncbi:MAG: helix-turn-helix transcriptional regulator [Candidatus Kariarchaeaceae archaeon]